MAVACLTYLSFDTFRSGSCANDEAFEQRLAENAFFNYSAHYWSEHVRPVESSTSRLALAFLCDEALVECTAQGALTPDYRYAGYSRSFPTRTSGLHLTARYGLPYLTERLLMGKHADSNITADSKDKDGRTPLSLAAERGHEAVVRLLVDQYDVEPDSKDEGGQTPLSLAAMYGHDIVVKCGTSTIFRTSWPVAGCHSLTVPSSDPEASSDPSREKPTARTVSVWPSSFRSAWPVAGSHSLTVLSQDADASRLPSYENATASTLPEWPASVCSAAPVAGSHSLTVLSTDADASNLLSGENATA
jgi:hypothetical protein